MEIHLVWVEFLPYILLRLIVDELYAVVFPWVWWSIPISYKPLTGATSFASMHALLLMGGRAHEFQLRIQSIMAISVKWIIDLSVSLKIC